MSIPEVTNFDPDAIPQEGDSEEVFNSNANTFLSMIPTVVTSWNTSIAAIASSITTMNDLLSSATERALSAATSSTEASDSATSAESSKSIAESTLGQVQAIWDTIQGYVIPTEATYSPDEIDVKISRRNDKLETALNIDLL